MKDVVVIYAVDPSENNFVAKETTLSAKSLRAHGGRYKDTPIYFIVPSAKKHDSEFVKSLAELSKIRNSAIVRKVLLTLEDSLKTDGYIAKPASLDWALRNLKHDAFLYVDCDTFFLKEPPFDELCDNRVYMHIQEDGVSYGDHLELLFRYSHFMFNSLYHHAASYSHIFGWILYSESNSTFWKDYYNQYRECIKKYDEPETMKFLLTHETYSQDLGARRGQDSNFVRGLIDEIVLSYLRTKYNALRMPNIAQDFGVTDDTWLFHFDTFQMMINEFKKTKKENLVKCLL